MPIWIILGIIILVALWAMGTYNGLIKARNMVYEAFSGIEVFLKKRFDLIPNLVEVVKGYAKHESETLEKVMQYRAEGGPKNVEEAAMADQKVSQALVSLRAVAEAYPDLKADTQYQQLMGDLGDMEDELASARRYYNGAARAYNDKLMVFPANTLAGLFNFKEEKYYEIEDAAQRQAPQVKF
jgi:LemA protein